MFSCRDIVFVINRLQLTLLGSGLAGSIDGDFDGLGVGGDLRNGVRLDADGDREGLSSAAASNESQIVEFGHLVLHHGLVVAHLPAVVLIVAGLDCDDGAVLNVVQGDHFEGAREALVAAPVIGQRRAEDGGRLGLHQLPVVLLEHLVDVGEHVVDCGRHRRTLCGRSTVW